MDCNYLKRLLACIAEVMQENRENLIQLDSIVGDGDLGLTMSDGFKAASESIQNTDETDIGKLLYMAGKAMSVAVPSTYGNVDGFGFDASRKGIKRKDRSIIDRIM